MGRQPQRIRGDDGRETPPSRRPLSRAKMDLRAPLRPMGVPLPTRPLRVTHICQKQIQKYWGFVVNAPNRDFGHGSLTVERHSRVACAAGDGSSHSGFLSQPPRRPWSRAYPSGIRNRSVRTLIGAQVRPDQGRHSRGAPVAPTDQGTKAVFHSGGFKVNFEDSDFVSKSGVGGPLIGAVLWRRREPTMDATEQRQPMLTRARRSSHPVLVVRRRLRARLQHPGDEQGFTLIELLVVVVDPPDHPGRHRGGAARRLRAAEPDPGSHRKLQRCPHQLVHLQQGRAERPADRDHDDAGLRDERNATRRAAVGAGRQRELRHGRLVRPHDGLHQRRSASASRTSWCARSAPPPRPHRRALRRPPASSRTTPAPRR